MTRENVQRKVVVMCNVSGRDLGGLVEDVRARVAAAVKLPPGYHVDYGGQFESAEQASRVLVLLGIAALSGGSAGSEIETPMAIVILCGLLTATALNMLVVPALSLRYGAVRERITRLAVSGVTT